MNIWLESDREAILGRNGMATRLSGLQLLQGFCPESVASKHLFTEIFDNAPCNGDDIVRARSLILATGVTWRRLAIDGFDRLIGKGVYYGAARSEVSATH